MQHHTKAPDPKGTHRWKHLGVIVACFAASVVITAVSTPFAGPSTPDLLCYRFGIVLIGHVLVALVALGSLGVPKFSWGSAAVIALLCLTPSLFFAGYAIKEDIYFRHYAVFDRFRDNLADPIPESVKNLRFTTIEESINPDLGFCFDIAATDLRDIIASKGLQPTTPEDLRCPRDFFKYPYYLPVHGEYVLYQGSDKYGEVLTLKVNESHTHAIYRRESETYYRDRDWEGPPIDLKMEDEALRRLKRKWKAEQGLPVDAEDGAAEG